MASIRRHRQKWQVQVRRLGLSPLTKTFTLKATAEAWARETELAIERGELKHDLARLKTTSLAELCWRYSREVLPRKRGADREHYFVQTILKHSLASLSLARLSSAEIAGFRDDRLKSVQAASVCRELAVLRHILETARIEWGYPVAVNPVALVSKPRLPLARNRRASSDELARLIAVAGKSRNKLLAPLIVFAVETGMRRSEILNMRWEDIDLGNRTVLIPETKNGHPRRIPISPRALEMLSTPDGCAGRVFPMTGNAVRLAWERLTKRASIADLHFHDLRHEAISSFFERGLSVPEVALISGHRDVRQLFRYTHLRAEDVAKKLG